MFMSMFRGGALLAGDGIEGMHGDEEDALV
jgi:hypothetical protein